MQQFFFVLHENVFRLTIVQAELQGHLNIKLNSLHMYSFKNHLNTFVELFTRWPFNKAGTKES